MKHTDLQDLEAIEITVNRIKDILEGKNRAMQGAILGDLLATWLHGHSSVDEDRAKTDQLRDEILATHIDYVKLLVKAYDLE